MRHRFAFVPLALALLAGPAAADQLTVFAASSLKGALDEIAADWGAETGHEVVISYGGSGALANQIIEGAPADIFVSANVEWMEAVAAAGRIDAATRRDLLGNTLVLIGPPGAAPLDPAGIAGALDAADGRLAVGQVASVPAGIYAQAALRALGLWDGLSGRLIETENVAAAARLVALGEAPLGIVFGSDATGDAAGVAVLATFPEDSYPPIVYPGAAMPDAGPVAAEFLAYLAADPAQGVFEAHGFVRLMP